MESNLGIERDKDLREEKIEDEIEDERGLLEGDWDYTYRTPTPRDPGMVKKLKFDFYASRTRVLFPVGSEFFCSKLWMSAVRAHSIFVKTI